MTARLLAPRRTGPGHLRPVLRAWRADRHGVAGLEIAFILPILLVLALVAFDLARYTIYVRKAHLAAATMADLLARADPDPALGNSTGRLTWSNLDSVFRTQLVVFPELMKEAQIRNEWVWSTVRASLSGIQFKTQSGCQSNCTYTAYVAWTAGQGRPCATPLTGAATAAQPSPSTLPSDIFGPGFLVVADLVFEYRPLFLRSVVGTVTVRRSFYAPPRYVSSIVYDPTASAGNAWVCVVPA
ncbi:MAG: pilus assembly protein [Parafilimonas terrae]|nr:pilus assembly protein [Parafilimonas terrae]